MLLSELTYTEIKAFLKTSDDLIIPVGTTEQHGLHLPVNNDVIIAEYFANELSRITKSLVAPSINYGVNLPLDKGFHGTAGVTQTTLKDILRSITAWWKTQGFKRFFIINYHGDPFHLKALSNIDESVHLFEIYEIHYSDVLEKQETIRHACEAETSITMYLYPEKVRKEKIREFDILYADFEKYLFHDEKNPPKGYIGCVGRPSYATVEKGKILVERMMTEMMRQYDEIINK